MDASKPDLLDVGFYAVLAIYRVLKRTCSRLLMNRLGSTMVLSISLHRLLSFACKLSFAARMFRLRF